jgi:hypothetical protein
MKVLLDIKDNKAAFFMELLKSFPYVKTKTLTPYKAEVLDGIREAVEEMKLIKAGKLKARNAEELFDEL